MITGRFCASGAVRKCSSIAWKPASISLELLGADARSSSTGRSPSPSSSGRRPSPRSRTCWRCRCRTRRRARRSSRPRRSAWRSRPRRRAAATTHARADCAFVSVSSVPNVFDETMNSVSSADRSRVASTKSVESTFETKRNVMSRSRVVAERLVRHHRPEVGAADADVHDVADGLAGVALPLARPHPVGERGSCGRAPRAPRRRRRRRRPRATCPSASAARRAAPTGPRRR